MNVGKITQLTNHPPALPMGGAAFPCRAQSDCSAAHADRKTTLTLCTVCKRDRRWPIDFVHTSYAVCRDCWDNWIADKPQNAESEVSE